MDFIFDPSLVLYLPLYELDGASLMSRDAYGHLCAVTGATWTPRGRDFDGTDDYINCGDATSLQDITEKTIIAWFKASGWGGSNAGRLVSKVNVNASGFSLLIQNGTSNRLYFLQDFSTSGGHWVTPTGSVSLDEWHHAGIIYDRSLASNDPLMYLQGISQTVTETTTPAGNVTSDVGNNLWLGARNNGGTPDRAFNGLIGEVWIYRRRFTPLEMQNHYLATKWRYR